jgi:hypothetical protein
MSIYTDACSKTRSGQQLNYNGWALYRQYKDTCDAIPASFQKNACDTETEPNLLQRYAEMYQQCGLLRQNFSRICIKPSRNDSNHEFATSSALKKANSCLVKAQRLRGVVPGMTTRRASGRRPRGPTSYSKLPTPQQQQPLRVPQVEPNEEWHTVHKAPHKTFTIQTRPQVSTTCNNLSKRACLASSDCIMSSSGMGCLPFNCGLRTKNQCGGSPNCAWSIDVGACGDVDKDGDIFF